MDNLVPAQKLDDSYNAIEYLKEMIIGRKCIHSGLKSKYKNCNECPFSHKKLVADNETKNIICDLEKKYE